MTPFRPSKATSSRKRHQFDEQSPSVPGMRPLKVARQVQKSNSAMQQKEEDLDKALQKAFVGKQSKCLIIAFHTTKAQKSYGSSHRTDTFQIQKFVLSVKDAIPIPLHKLLVLTG